MIDATNKVIADTLINNISATYFIVSEEQDDFVQTQVRKLRVNISSFITERTQFPITFVGISSISTDTGRMGNLIDKGNLKLADSFKMKYIGSNVTSCQINYDFRTYCVDMNTALESLESIFFLPRELSVKLSEEKIIPIRVLVTNFMSPLVNLKYGRNKYYTVGASLMVDSWIMKNIEIPSLKVIDMDYYTYDGLLLFKKSLGR